VRETARQAGVAKNTSFRWRHRFLRLDKDALKQTLTGIVEIDESFVLESRKGERGLPRDARKCGGKAKKPGLPPSALRRPRTPHPSCRRLTVISVNCGCYLCSKYKIHCKNRDIAGT
jgi:hypothetical protein